MAKIHTEHFPTLLKLAKLYFMIQNLSMPRFCMEVEQLNNLDLYLVGFGDGSLDFSTACIYLISAHWHTAK